VQAAFLDGLIQRRNGLAIGLLSGGFVALGDGLAQVAELRAQAGGVGTVARGATFGLTGALQRRKMICHIWFVTFVYSERYSGGSEFLIIGEQLSVGQTDVASPNASTTKATEVHEGKAGGPRLQEHTRHSL